MVNYDAYAETFSNSRKNLRWWELDAIIEDMVQSGYMSVLDVGCGNGRLIEQLTMNNEQWVITDYLGIDNSAGMITEARKIHPNHQFEVCPMESLWKSEYLKPTSYDAIVFLASFHHLETREERIHVLKDIRRYLTPAGAIYMTNWNLRDQQRYEKNHQWDGDFDIKIWEYSRYYHGFTLEELAELFETTGYKIVENKIFEWGRNIWSKITL